MPVPRNLNNLLVINFFFFFFWFTYVYMYVNVADPVCIYYACLCSISRCAYLQLNYYDSFVNVQVPNWRHVQSKIPKRQWWRHSSDVVGVANVKLPSSLFIINPHSLLLYMLYHAMFQGD